jgi:DNA-binding beta-propeller fold protein YncE
VAAVALGLASVPAQAAPGDPLFTFVPPTVSKVPPVGYFEGPCGLAVDSTGRLYVSDYYHHTVDVFSLGAPLNYLLQLANEDPLDGPCGLALDSTNRLYVNNFDRNVVRFGASSSFGAGTTIAGAGVDTAHPTGVAVDPATNDAYVDDRTYLTGYDSTGAQLTDGAEPLRIGLDPSAEYYGLAIDATGLLYVADASDDTVKAYDPAVSLSAPVKTFTGPPSGFTSLRHAALAVDRTSKILYVLDNLQPSYAEQPAAQVEAFDLTLPPASSYLGVLKFQVVDALPAGLAVDNSPTATQGRVYVTSGNSNQAGIYAYAFGSLVASSQPPTVGFAPGAAGALSAAATPSPAALGATQPASAEAPVLAQRVRRHHRHRRRVGHRYHRGHHRASMTANSIKKSR